MFKKKQNPEDTDWQSSDEPSGYESSKEYDDYSSGYDSTLDGERKKKHLSCLFAALIGLVLGAGVFFAFVANHNSKTVTPAKMTTASVTASFPTASVTATFPTDNDKPAQVSAGLVSASYKANGKRETIDNPYNSPDAFVPISLPVTTGENVLSRLDAIAYPEGAFFDPQSGQLVVFGPPAKTGDWPASDNFLVALRAVYNQQELAISIDPGGSATTQSVRYLGPTAATNFGFVMFEADRCMKTLSMGQDNISGEAVTSQVPGHASLFDLEFQSGSTSLAQVRRRFWFTVPIAEIEQSTDQQSMLISQLRLDIKTEYLDSNWETLKIQPSDPAGQAFTAQLSENYDEYAREFPVFDDLKALARWTALAHWLKQANLSDLAGDPQGWLVNSPTSYDAPLTTPAITVSRQNTQGNTIQTMTLWGGVDLGMTINIRVAQDVTKERIKQLSDSFKAALKMGKLNTTPAGVTFAPLASLQIDHNLTLQVDLPLDLAPSLQYSSLRWELRVPTLHRQGGEQADSFTFDDPNLQQPVLLRNSGVDSQTKAAIYVDEQTGLWLTIYSNAYTLARGEFQPDGTFLHNPDELMVFDLAGHILEDVKTGVKYSYQDGRLAHILRGNQDMEITWDANGQITQVRMNDNQIDFKYEKGFLSALLNKKGESIRKFEYDGKGRITREMGADPKFERSTRYDANGWLLFQAENGQGTLYDWRTDGTPALFAGQALAPWVSASEKDLGELKVGLRLRQDAQIEHLFFARHIGSSLVMFANDRSYTLPDYMLKNPAGLRAKLASLAGQDQPGEMALVSNAGIQGVSFQALFPKAIPLNVEIMDEVRVRENIKLLHSPLKFDATQADVINALPQPGELVNVGLASAKPGLWYAADNNGKTQTLKDFLDLKIAKAGFGTFPQVATLERLKKSLSTFASVLIVVGHSDGQYIYLPDGTKFSPSSLSRQEIEKIAAQHPLMIFMSCETAAVLNGKTSLSQQFLELGPRQVIAPNGTIPVQDANDILQAFLENPVRESNALQAFIQAIQKVYPDGLIPSMDGLEHFFEFRTQRVFPTA